MSALDPFALGGQQEGREAEILELFHRWLDVCRVLDETISEKDAWCAAIDRQVEIENRIFECRGGARGFAIKTFLEIKRASPNWTPSHAQLRLHDNDDPEGWQASMLRDAALVVPEIEELAAAVIHEDAALVDAEMDLLWLKSVGRGNDHTAEWRARALATGRKALSRIARTKAKTPRGEAIKATYAETVLL